MTGTATPAPAGSGPAVSPELEREIARLVAEALAEDVGSGDATTASTLPENASCAATILSRKPGVISGLAVGEAVYAACEGELQTTRRVVDGDSVEAGAALLAINGAARAILVGERVALNFLGHMSGIATLTRAYVDAVRGTKATILDTRKTTPGLRQLEKYAVLCGGGTNHRMGLYDAILIKDNHLLLSGSIADAVARARTVSDLEITVEVENTEELEQALAAGADRILLDNMSPAELRDAVALAGGRVPLEASGGINLDTAAEIAAAGVDFLSVGSLTHSAPALDVSLDVTA